jgi:hypothetical protein
MILRITRSLWAARHRTPLGAAFGPPVGPMPTRRTGGSCREQRESDNVTHAERLARIEYSARRRAAQGNALGDRLGAGPGCVDHGGPDRYRPATCAKLSNRDGRAVPGRKTSASAAGEGRDRRQQTPQQIKLIVAERDSLIADIAALRAAGATSKFVDNAQQLLTRWWSTANWNGREDLLKTAAWLVRIEQRQIQPPHDVNVQSPRQPAGARARNRVASAPRR